jgi:FdrA protein
MHQETHVFKNRYIDSVSLMSLAAKVKKQEGIVEVVIAMATDMNKAIISQVGLSNSEVEQTSVNDLIIGIIAQSEERVKEAFDHIENQLSGGSKSSSSSATEKVFTSMDDVLDEGLKPDVAIFSIPGTICGTRSHDSTQRRHGCHDFLRQHVHRR